MWPSLSLSLSLYIYIYIYIHIHIYIYLFINWRCLRQATAAPWFCGRKGFLGGWKVSPGPLKRSSEASNMGPGASKMAPSWIRIGQHGVMEALRHPKRAKQTQGKRHGRASGSQNGSQEVPGHPKILLKWSNMRSKWGLKPVQHGIRFRVLKNIDFSSNFKSNFY